MVFNKLRDAALRDIRVGGSRLSDGGALYLKPAQQDRDSHGWRLDYSLGGKRKTLSLGTYPDVSLAGARESAQRIRADLAEGRDPSAARKLGRLQLRESLRVGHTSAGVEPARGSFEEIARRWFESKKCDWMDVYSSKLLRRLELHVFPYIGSMPIGQIQVVNMLEICRRVQTAGALETGHRVRELCSWVFQFAIAEDVAKTDPCRDIRRALRTPQERHFPALIRPADIATYLHRADKYEGTFVVRSALQLIPMLMVRPGELRLARWEEFDLDNALWVVPSLRLKRTKTQKLNGKPHLVHLPRQAVEILEELFLLTGRSGYVFAGTGCNGTCISNSTVHAALRRLGYCTKTEVTGHGFRATFRTLTVELLRFPEAVAEMQLAHAVKDENGSAYNRAEFLEQRQALMQAWADYLEDLKNGRAKVSHPLLTDFTPVTLRLQAPQHM